VVVCPVREEGKPLVLALLQFFRGSPSDASGNTMAPAKLNEPDQHVLDVNRKEFRVKDYLDGTSKTLFLGEITGGAPGSKEGYTWVQFNLFDTSQGINGPNTIAGEGTFVPFLPDGKKSFSSYHPGGCHFAFVDGSAHFLAEDIDQAALRSLTTRRGISRDNQTDVLVNNNDY
jgi:prepilin-type processing-associated H-X9-DG protein